MEGYVDEAPAFVDEARNVVGTASEIATGVGNDAPASILRWTLQGVPSVPAPTLRGFPLALRNDGSVLLQERATERLLLLKDGKTSSLGLRATLPSASPDGTVVFVTAEGSGSISAYRVP